MNEVHLAYLNLGSNIQPEINLPKALKLLSEYGEILQRSQVWESEPVGTTGNNYLNICIKFKVELDQLTLKEKVLHLIEEQLGRKYTHDKYAPRTMDIDIILFDNQVINNACWTLPFVVVPLADIYPGYRIIANKESVLEAAKRLRRNVWLESRQGVLG